MSNIENNVENRKQIIEMLKSITNYFNDMRDVLCAPYGLSSIQAIIVLDIYHHPNETKVTDICKRLNKSTNTISPLINRLIKKEFLYKEQSKEDQRVFNVHLTKKSEKILNDIVVDVNDFTWPIFDSFTDSEFTQIYNALSVMNGVVEKWNI